MFSPFMSYLTVALLELRDREEGQGLVEYALILVFVSVVAIATLSALGGSVSGIFTTIKNTL